MNIQPWTDFSILPPFNTLNAQVLRTGSAGNNPELLDPSQVEVRYSPAPDRTGSINSTSIGKTNFWDYVLDLFGAQPEPDSGFTGAKMPSGENGPQPFMSFETAHRRFVAAGIPITPTDDANNTNTYPMFRVDAFDRNSGELLASIDTVVPVSTEMNCSRCHNDDGVAADTATAQRYSLNEAPLQWSTNPNPSIEYRENILLLHDAKHGTALRNDQPVLCADCHYSPALDLAGSGPQGPQQAIPYLSRAIHQRHGKTMSGELPSMSNTAIIADNGTDGCFQCHPGEQTQCFRGAMANAGLSCESCHGGMLAVGGQFTLANGVIRQPWSDLPKCQSCHTGDALNHAGSELISNIAFDPNDKAATPRLALNTRFAENDNDLYRNSTGHGGVACTSCHGSPHAIWPNDDPNHNDNIPALQLQGYAGTVTECETCHESGTLPLSLDGPHGMHNVADSRWNKEHGEYYEANPAACQTCHGVDLQGTALSRMATDRLLDTDERQPDGSETIRLAKGTEVSCALCHEAPLL